MHKMYNCIILYDSATASLVYCIVTPLLYDYAHEYLYHYRYLTHGFRYLCTGIPTDLDQAKTIKVTHRYRSR